MVKGISDYQRGRQDGLAEVRERIYQMNVGRISEDETKQRALKLINEIIGNSENTTNGGANVDNIEIERPGYVRGFRDALLIARERIRAIKPSYRGSPALQNHVLGILNEIEEPHATSREGGRVIDIAYGSTYVGAIIADPRRYADGHYFSFAVDDDYGVVLGIHKSYSDAEETLYWRAVNAACQASDDDLPFD